MDAIVERLDAVDALPLADQLTELSRMQAQLAAVLDADDAEGAGAPA